MGIPLSKTAPPHPEQQPLQPLQQTGIIGFFPMLVQKGGGIKDGFMKHDGILFGIRFLAAGQVQAQGLGRFQGRQDDVIIGRIILINPQIFPGFFQADQHGLSLRLHLQGLDRFLQHQHAIDALACEEADLAVGGIQFVEPLEGAVFPVGNPIVAEIAEEHGAVAGRQFRGKGSTVAGTVQDGIRCPGCDGRLPDVVAVVVFDFAQGLDRSIVQEPYGLAAVRDTQGMIQIDDIIKGDGCAIGRHAQFRRREHASRLVLPVASKKGFFFLGADTAGKFAGDIAFQVKEAVVQEFFRHTDSRPQFVCPDGLLAEGILAVRIQAVFFHPCGFPMACHDGNLAVAAGMDDCCQAAEEILFLEFVNELMLEFIRHQIAAIGIRANTQGILHIDKVLMTDAVPEGFPVSVGCTAFLFVFRLGSPRCSVMGTVVGFDISASIRCWRSRRSISFPRFTTSSSILSYRAASSAETIPLSSRTVSRKFLADSQRFFLFSRSAKIVSIMLSSYQ
nr:MAG TPA: hypothetical protein [Caudoviricetes sp.]